MKNRDLKVKIFAGAIAAIMVFGMVAGVIVYLI